MVSIGNVTCGGTGKTPAVEMVARDLLALGQRPAILSRGYRAPRREREVASAHHPSAGDSRPLAGLNDEMRVLAANLPGVPLYQGKDRYRSGVAAVREGADVLVLDDGFQHASLARDLDLVLIDALDPFGGGRVLPAGLLREPLGVLARAHLLGITRSRHVAAPALATLESYLRARFPRIPRLLIAAQPLFWQGLAGERFELEALRGRRTLAFSGIGNPEAFRRELLALGVELVDHVSFRDHHRYTATDIERLLSRAERLGAEEVVMTQKDAVKIPVSGRAAAWKLLRIESRVIRGEESYREALARVTAR